MRHLYLSSLLLFSALLHAAPPAPETFAEVFDLAGLRLLCEQTAPLVERGMPAEQQAKLQPLFVADTLCLDLARQVAASVSVEQLQQAQHALASPLAQRFTAVERAVGDNETELNAYREQLAARPPRDERLALVRRLDAAAQTTALAALLRYEVGKTQSLLALKGQGQSIDEATLSSKTTAQEQALRQSSAQAVETFMLFAYRQTPSDQLAEYVALYEQEPVSLLLKSAVLALPKVFAQRRAALR